MQSCNGKLNTLNNIQISFENQSTFYRDLVPILVGVYLDKFHRLAGRHRPTASCKSQICTAAVCDDAHIQISAVPETYVQYTSTTVLIQLDTSR